MTTAENEGEVALIVGGGPGVSSSCAKRFSEAGMRVAVAARNPEKKAAARAAGPAFAAASWPGSVPRRDPKSR